MTARRAGAIAGAAAAVLAFCVPAFAESTLRLTPAQSLALYGGTISADRYEWGTFVETVSFDYVGKTSDYGSSAYGENCSVLSIYNDPQTNISGQRALINQYDYLIYRYVAHNWQTNNSLQFSINIPAELEGITGYAGGIMVSCGGYNTYGTDYMYAMDCVYYTNKGSKTVDCNRNSNNGPVIAHIAMAQPDAFGVVNDKDIVAVQYFAMQDPEYLHYDGLEFDLTNFRINYGHSSGNGQSMVTGYNTYLYIMLPCPVLYDYDVPATTAPTVSTTTTTITRPAVTQRYTLAPPLSTAPVHTVDLSNLESGVAAIVQQGIDANNNLDWIGNNMYIGVNNLSYIANRLDDIYDAMLKAGEVPVNGSDTQDMIAAVGSALGEYTTARIPDDATQGVRFWAAIVKFLYDDLGWAAGLAAFGLAMSLTCWILFRGRNA